MPEHERASPAACATSPLLICDRLISLAQAADRAGYAATADHLVRLAHTMFNETDRPAARRRPS
ncbi:hypothetical protein [Limobrevibacterium gyesilva]|uniref:Uncharacterized protein n=1 Tax=Limobrevibacterium gyesilva TaxID=2991712 RepID=A0AA42CEY7_9PROT|nr:hypothetical protein [Limobrevibacterium gyesilva]MCW3475879.1 hypothetical protein [Limobrevibacterium gyesilva]